MVPGLQAMARALLVRESHRVRFAPNARDFGSGGRRSGNQGRNDLFRMAASLAAWSTREKVFLCGRRRQR